MDNRETDVWILYRETDVKSLASLDIGYWNEDSDNIVAMREQMIARAWFGDEVMQMVTSEEHLEIWNTLEEISKRLIVLAKRLVALENKMR